MATHVRYSMILPLPIDQVWQSIRDFRFPAKLIPSQVESCKIIGGGSSPFAVGAIRELRWKTGQWRHHRLLELSDQFYRTSWEIVSASEPIESSSIISSLQLIRITEEDHTLIDWSADFSSDTPSSFVLFERKSYQSNLEEIREVLTGAPLPTIHHIHEGPSCRVSWLAGELGVPVRVSEKRPSLRSSSLTEVPAHQGGLLTCFQHGPVEILESGAVCTYLLETFDKNHRLSPPLGSELRAKYHQAFFFATSTCDAILMDAYIRLHVLQSSTDGEPVGREEDWKNHVVPQLRKLIGAREWICGSQFTAADVMIGWSLYVAELLGWLDEKDHTLWAYFTRLRNRCHFQAAFNLASSDHF